MKAISNSAPSYLIGSNHPTFIAIPVDYKLG